jgi:hypothetical protein
MNACTEANRTGSTRPRSSAVFTKNVARIEQGKANKANIKTLLSLFPPVEKKDHGIAQNHTRDLRPFPAQLSRASVMECGCAGPFFRPVLLRALCLFVLTCSTALAMAGLELVSEKVPLRVFSGGVRTVPVVWRNTGDRPASLSLSRRFYQASSATAAPLSQTPWKELTILPGQTVLESVTLDVPAVSAQTRFLVQWLQNSNSALGVTEVWAYPTNILRELGALAGVEPAGLYDPQNQLKPLLRAVHVEYVDLEEAGLERFVGRLVIVGPFASREQVCEWLPDSLRSLAMRGVAVVWLLPPVELRGKIKPSFYTVLEGKGSVVVVQAGMLGDLSQNPQAQVDLVDLCRQAVKPQPLQLPFLASQP